MSVDKSYGIVVRRVGPKDPIDDECHFDGWYTNLTMAKQMAAYYSGFYRDHIIEVVEFKVAVK